MSRREISVGIDTSSMACAIVNSSANSYWNHSSVLSCSYLDVMEGSRYPTILMKIGIDRILDKRFFLLLQRRC